ncbi:MAG: ABC transporter permease [Saprospiraceae bacterium]
MNKLWLIIKREYLTRVKKKSFILITLLSPLIMVAFITLPALLVVFAGGDEQKSVAVIDDSGTFTDSIESNERVNFALESTALEDLKTTYKEKGYDGVLHIPSFGSLDQELSIVYYSEGQLSLSTKELIERKVADRIEDYKIAASGYDQGVLKSFKTDISLDQKELAFDENGRLIESDKKNSAGVATAIGFISGFIIYIVLIFYGAMIMRSVMEEKTNRIVEVIISSVKPIQLMLGKIIGVSGVGLTQMVVWIVLTVVLMSVAGMFVPIDPSAMQDSMSHMQQQPPNEALAQFSDTLSLIRDQNWGYIIPVFLFYFLGGYFIYASLFAAVGSAMGDDMGEGQSLSFVAMFPIIISIVLISPVIENPASPLATWLSIIPLCSPVIMPARIAFEPPLWEVLVSMVVLGASAFFFVWLAGRIYRVGILLYGKKASLKELGKWMFYKD